MHISPGWFRAREIPVAGSMTLSSALRTTVPHEPGLVGKGFLAKDRLMVRTGPASVMP